MKKFLLFVLLIFFTFTSFSQEKGFSGGIYAGGVTSQVDGDTFAGYNKFGVNAGIYSIFNLNKEWFANLQIGYINKGSKFRDAKSAKCYTLILNYIEIPIFLTYKPQNLIKNTKDLSFDLGLSPSILINAKEDFNCLTPIEINDEIKKLDISFLFGINWQLNKHLKVGTRLLYTIIPIGKTQRLNLYKKGQFNNVIALNLFYTF